MGLLKQVIGSAVAARVLGARSSSSVPLLIAGVLARRASPLMIAAVALLAARMLEARQPAQAPRRRVGRRRP